MSDRPAALCMPLLKTPVHLTASGIVESWKEVWSQRPAPTDIEIKQGAFTCEIDGVLVGGMVMPAPIPGDEVAGPAATAWLWPGASHDLEGYGAHAVVFASRAASRLAAYQAMTRAAVAIVRASNALGVYVGSAGIVVRADIFVGMAQDMELPLALWVDLRCVAAPSGKAGLFTVGLSEFGLLEIEIAESSKNCGDLRLWTLNLASWLIETQPKINPGETVGLSAEEKVCVEHAPSMVGREGNVMRLSGV